MIGQIEFYSYDYSIIQEILDDEGNQIIQLPQGHIDIIRKKYPNGWTGWLNDRMSDEDDGQLTRFTTMDGRHMHMVVDDLISYGFKPPELINGVFHCKENKTTLPKDPQQPCK